MDNKSHDADNSDVKQVIFQTNFIGFFEPFFSQTVSMWTPCQITRKSLYILRALWVSELINWLSDLQGHLDGYRTMYVWFIGLLKNHLWCYTEHTDHFHHGVFRLAQQVINAWWNILSWFSSSMVAGCAMPLVAMCAGHWLDCIHIDFIDLLTRISPLQSSCIHTKWPLVYFVLHTAPSSSIHTSILNQTHFPCFVIKR